MRLASWIALLLGLVVVRSTAVSAESKPKLVVMISIDQFPYEYLERMRGGFSQDGAFLRLCDEGANYTNCHHGQAFTKTGPGHSVFLSGAFPAQNGIIDNDWYDPESKGKKNRMYCVDDAEASTVGAVGKDIGKSPKNLLTATLGDVLRLRDPKSRVVGIGLKDRAAILMAGHAADGAYWLEGGNWVTSSHYRKELPGYLRELNEGGRVNKYAEETWSLVYPEERYTLYYPDDAAWEGELPGSGRAFPHKMPKADDPKYTTAMTTSPFGTEYTLATAGIIMSAEKLGQRDSIDLIAINLSSNDYVGHMFGPHSLEVQDMTYRTDQILGKFLEYIERHMKGEPWVLALSSDHGVAPIPEYAKTLGLPAGRDQLDLPALKKKIETALTDAFGEPKKGSKYVLELDDGNVYLNNDLPKLSGDQGWAARDLTRRVLIEESTIAIAFIREELITQAATEGLEQQFQRCYHPKRSGDVLFAQTPYQILGKTTATHGSPWQYDSHVPLLMYGAGVQGGRHGREVTPASIAPTLARILGVEPPPSCAVDALEEAIAKPRASASAKK